MRLTALFIIYSSTRWKGDTGLSPRNTLETHVMLFSMKQMIRAGLCVSQAWNDKPAGLSYILLGIV